MLVFREFLIPASLALALSQALALYLDSLDSFTLLQKQDFL